MRKGITNAFGRVQLSCPTFEAKVLLLVIEKPLCGITWYDYFLSCVVVTYCVKLGDKHRDFKQHSLRKLKL